VKQDQDDLETLPVSVLIKMMQASTTLTQRSSLYFTSSSVGGVKSVTTVSSPTRNQRILSKKQKGKKKLAVSKRKNSCIRPFHFQSLKATFDRLKHKGAASIRTKGEDLRRLGRDLQKRSFYSIRRSLKDGTKNNYANKRLASHLAVSTFATAIGNTLLMGSGFGLAGLVSGAISSIVTEAVMRKSDRKKKKWEWEEEERSSEMTMDQVMDVARRQNSTEFSQTL